MRSAVTISLVPEAKGGPFVFSSGLANGCVHAAHLGFDAVEIFPPHAAAIDVPALKALLREHRLQVAAVGTGSGWLRHKLTLTHADPAIRAQARAFIEGIVDVAAELGAPAIVGSMQGRWEGNVTREQALQWLSDALANLGARAGKAGVTLLYEPLNRYETNLFNRLGDTATWLRTEQLNHVRILADLFHMNIEEADLAAALRAAGDRVGHVHFADSNRRAIGFGHTGVTQIVEALREIDYSGYLSAEIFPLPDPVAAATQTIRAFRVATAAS